MRFPSVTILETSSLCNRACPTCIRNSNPDRESVQSWFEHNLMPMRTIKEFARQYHEQGFSSKVCLCYYNEPLLDPRIVGIAEYLKASGIQYLYLVTNGDHLTEYMAKRLDGVLDRITVSLYYDRDSRKNKKAQMRSLFKKTKVWIKGQHMDTHFNPGAIPLNDQPCKQQRVSTRLIINHKGEYCLCCDDLTGLFDLGTFPETSLKEYWFGEKHTSLVHDLQIPGGRNKYPYCSTCPRVW